MKIFKKTFGRCGYCGYVWVLRVSTNKPKTCSQCKQRFKHTGASYATKEVEIWAEEFETYDEVRKRLEELNG